MRNSNRTTARCDSLRKISRCFHISRIVVASGERLRHAREMNHRIDAIERTREPIARYQIAARHFNWSFFKCTGAPYQHAHTFTASDKFRYEMASDEAGPACHEDHPGDYNCALRNATSPK